MVEEGAEGGVEEGVVEPVAGRMGIGKELLDETSQTISLLFEAT